MRLVSLHRLAGGMAVAAGLLAGLLASAPARAAAPPRHEARFSAEVEGLATTTWTTTRAEPGPCGATWAGHGSERFTFSTRRAVGVTATSLGASDPLLTFGPGGRFSTLPVEGRVRRQGTLDVTPNPGECAGGGGDLPIEPLVPRDCRTKGFTARLALRYARGAVMLSTQSASARYRNCPTAGTSFPSVTTLRGGRLLTVAWPSRDVFDASQRRVILVGTGRQASNVGGTRSVSAVRWTVTLDRLD